MRTRLAITRVVDDQHTLSVWRRSRIAEQQRQAPGIDRFRIPRRLGQEELQPLDDGSLCRNDRLDSRQRSQRLVAITRQEQTLEILAKPTPLCKRAEQRIKLGSGTPQAAPVPPDRRDVRSSPDLR